MSKIYEALLRAEQDRVDAMKQTQPVHEQAVAASSWKEMAASATALEEMPVPVEPEVGIPAQEEELISLEAVATPPAPVAAAYVAPAPPVPAPAYVAPTPVAPVYAAPAPAVAKPAPVAARPAAPVQVAAKNPVAPIASGAAYVPGTIEPLDVSAIRTTVWKPALEKLPGLEERGSAVEQFRSLRTRLFGFRDLNKLKSILVSSGLPREGKSFIAANLAVSFARHKASRVLLIDGDMRRSSLHSVFGCDRSPGLTSYLAGHANMSEIMQRAALNEDGTPLFMGLGSLTFIGGGEEGDKAADLSGSGRFKQLIESAAPHFDWIIVDSSPVNLVTDGVNLANACDAVLMVARGGVTKFEAAQRALAELKSSKILGVVLNAVDHSPTSNGYYGYDGYDTPQTPPGPPAQ